MSRNPKESARAKGYEDAFKIFILDVGLLGALFRRPNFQREEVKKIFIIKIIEREIKESSG